jgi:hypothetical protein
MCAGECQIPAVGIQGAVLLQRGLMAILCCWELSALERVMEVIGGAEQRMGEFVSFLSPTKENNTTAAQQSLTQMEGYGAQLKWIRMETMCRMRGSGDTVVSSARPQD